MDTDYKQIYVGKNGGVLYLHPLAKTDEIPLLTQKGIILADLGHEVRIRPEIFGEKNPDYIVNGNLADLKSPLSAKKLVHRLQQIIWETNEQLAKIVIIDCENPLITKRDLKRAIGGSLTPENYNQNITDVWLMIGNEVVKISRDKVVNKKYLKIIDDLKNIKAE